MRITLKDILFENVEDVLKLEPEPTQQKFVEPISYTIALAYAGINEGWPGFLSLICENEEPVGIILLGRSPVHASEPQILHKYEFVYRLLGFFIDKHHQNKGIGRAALTLALDRLGKCPDDAKLPIALEVHHENMIAIKLYESLGFANTGVKNDENIIYVKLPCEYI